jgi:hypothetical protein
MASPPVTRIGIYAPPISARLAVTLTDQPAKYRVKRKQEV